MEMDDGRLDGLNMQRWRLSDTSWSLIWMVCNYNRGRFQQRAYRFALKVRLSTVHFVHNGVSGDKKKNNTVKCK